MEKIIVRKKTFCSPKFLETRSGNLFLPNGENQLIRSVSFEVAIPAQAVPVNKYSFPDVQYLRNTSLWSLSTYSSTLIPISMISKNALVTPAILQSSFLTMLDYSGTQILQQHPLIEFSDNSTNSGGAINSSSIQRNGFVGQRLSYNQCFIEVADTTKIPPNTALVFLILVRFSLYANIYRDSIGGSFGSRNTNPSIK